MTAEPTCREAFGLDVLMDHGGFVALATAGSPPQRILPHRGPTASANPRPSLEVDDVDPASARVHARGPKMVHPLSDEE